MIVYKIRIQHLGKASYRKSQKKTPMDTHFTTDFYEDYFMRYSEHVIWKIEYSNITRFIETDKSFYLEYNGVFIFQKDTCSSELVEFVRNKCSSAKSDDRRIKNDNFPIDTIMLVLFILTIACLFFGLKTMNFLAGDSLNFHFMKYAWGFWLWLPVPILSIILGFKYRKRGYKCTKNIVAGFIIGIFLLIYGGFCLIPMGDADYSQIYQYKNILSIDLPSDGTLTENYFDTYFDNAVTSFTDTDVTFDKSDVKAIESSVTKNPNWMSADALNSSLKIFIPDTMILTDTSYISIYNSTINQYNSIPDENGNYHIYVMLFDSQGCRLEINDYYYNYVN